MASSSSYDNSSDQKCQQRHAEASITDLSRRMGAHSLSMPKASPFVTDPPFTSPFNADWNGFSLASEPRNPTPPQDSESFFSSLSWTSPTDAVSPAPSLVSDHSVDDDSTDSDLTPTQSAEETFQAPPPSPMSLPALLPSWAAPADAGWAMPLRTRPSMTSIRRQRQEALRKQASTSHLREIKALVARMVDRGNQCSVSEGSAVAHTAREEPELREEDADSMDMDGCDGQCDDDGDSSEVKARKHSNTSSGGGGGSRRSSAAGRVAAMPRTSAGVSKLDRLAGAGPSSRRRGGILTASNRRVANV